MSPFNLSLNLSIKVKMQTNNERDDFDQETAWEAPVCQSKYTALWKRIQDFGFGVTTQTSTICREVFNLPHKFHLYKKIFTST